MVESICVPNFHMFYANSLPFRAFTVQVANSQVSTILDSFSTVINCIRRAPKGKGGGGQEGW